jgi:hypothetical protein
MFRDEVSSVRQNVRENKWHKSNNKNRPPIRLQKYENDPEARVQDRFHKIQKRQALKASIFRERRKTQRAILKR